MLDVLILNGIIVTMAGKYTGILKDGAVGIKGNKIVCVGDSEGIKREYKAKRMIDATGKLVMPGFINAHTHSSDIFFRGIMTDIEFYLEQGYAGFFDHLNIDTHIAGTKLHLLNGLKYGVTTYCDNIENLYETAKVYEDYGVRARISNCIRELSWDYKDVLDEIYTFDRSFAEEGITDTIKILEKYGTDPRDRITCMVSAQAIDLVSESLLIELRELAKKHSAMMHIHLAQSKYEMIQAEKRFGKSPVNILEQLDLLNSNTLAAHLIFNSPEDNIKAAKSGMRMAYCPTNSGRKGFISPAAEYVEAGGIVGIGTDEAISNGVNIFNEMKVATLMTSARARNTGAEIIPLWKLLRMATIESAEAIGLEQQIGSLEPGKLADLIILDISVPNLSPLYMDPIKNIVQMLIYTTSGHEVEAVMVDGKFLMEDGKMKYINETDVMMDVQKEADRIIKGAYNYYKALPESEVLQKQIYYD